VHALNKLLTVLLRLLAAVLIALVLADMLHPGHEYTRSFVIGLVHVCANVMYYGLYIFLALFAILAQMLLGVFEVVPQDIRLPILWGVLALCLFKIVT
jgi:hypothetical protein